MSENGKLNFWLVACETGRGRSREQLQSALSHALIPSKLAVTCAPLEIPRVIKSKGLDELIKLADDLVRHDQTVEQSCRRVERLGLDVDPSIEYVVIHQRTPIGVTDYLSRFSWDDAKYPLATRSLKQNMDLLLQSVTKLDEELRIKNSIFSDIKAKTNAAQSGASSSFHIRELDSVITPQLVDDSDFIDTEHLTTVVAVVPLNEAASFPAKFWKWSDKVLPGSEKQLCQTNSNSGNASNAASSAEGHHRSGHAHRQGHGAKDGAKDIPLTDKENNTIFIFVAFKSVLAEIKEEARKLRITLRTDFHYSPSAFRERERIATEMSREKDKQTQILSRLCVAVFSEFFIAWMHIKVARIYVEAALRYGQDPQYSAFTLMLPPPGKIREARLETELLAILAPPASQRSSYFTLPVSKDASAVNASPEEEDLRPYIVFTLVPFAQTTQK